MVANPQDWEAMVGSGRIEGYGFYMSIRSIQQSLPTIPRSSQDKKTHFQSLETSSLLNFFFL